MNGIGTDITPQEPRGEAAGGHRHPVARALAWVLGAVAVALTGLFAWAGIDTIVSWSSYVGGERSTVLFIMGFLALLSVLAWLGTRIAFVASRR